MIKALEDKTLEMLLRFDNFMTSLKDERGQTSGEYVAVTAVGVIIAISIMYTLLKGGITTAINTIVTKLTTFVSTAS